MGKYSATADHGAVPQVIFTDPEVGSVGLTEAQARQARTNIRVVDYPLGKVAGARLYADDYRGHARLVVDEDRRVVVGATFVGAAVSELVHSATVAIVGEVRLERLWHAVPPYPTMSEIGSACSRRTGCNHPRTAPGAGRRPGHGRAGENRLDFPAAPVSIAAVRSVVFL